MGQLLLFDPMLNFLFYAPFEIDNFSLKRVLPVQKIISLFSVPQTTEEQNSVFLRLFGLGVYTPAVSRNSLLVKTFLCFLDQMA